MLTPPDISDDRLIAHLRDKYGLHVTQLDFLPLGADVNSAVYRVEAGGRAYFLKLRHGPPDELSATIPAFLAEHGVAPIISPRRTVIGQLWTALEPFTVTLYPFVTGADGYEVAMSERQWVALGVALRRIHAANLPPDLWRALPREDYSPRWREQVRGYVTRVGRDTSDDPIAAELVAFLRTNALAIRELVEGAERLGRELEEETTDFTDCTDSSRGALRKWTLCHADLHNGNVLIGANGSFHIVDWDTALLAPKERDLMFVGAGNLGRGRPEEIDWFYRGYGATTIDPAALAYYRCERIVQDIAAFCEQILDTSDGDPDRAQALRWLKSQFQPHCEVEIALAGSRGQVPGKSTLPWNLAPNS